MRTKTITRWRRAALASAAALALTGPGALAQDAQPTAPAAQPPAEAAPTGPTAPPDAPPPTASETRPTPAKPVPDSQPLVVPPGTPEEYTIQKGDTLWDLSQKFLNSPWYWPKIWSQNPSIENPHWIYPGNKLKLVPGQGGPQAPAQAEAAGEAPAQAQAQEPGQSEAAPPELRSDGLPAGGSPDLEVVKRNSAESRAASGSVSASGRLSFKPPPVVKARASGLVTAEDLAASGSVDASFEEKGMLATYDTAYVRYQGDAPVKAGDKLLLFRNAQDVIHPKTHQLIAKQTVTTAVARVISVKGSLATVQIQRTFEEVSRGDRVRPYTEQDMRIAPKANVHDVLGFIVASTNQGLTTYGEANEVFIDKGSADGVEEGNTFAVVRRGDGLNRIFVGGQALQGEQGISAAKVDVPDENVGLLLVIDVKEHLSTALVVRSLTELSAGDEVEMHPGAGAGGN